MILFNSEIFVILLLWLRHLLVTLLSAIVFNKPHKYHIHSKYNNCLEHKPAILKCMQPTVTKGHNWHKKYNLSGILFFMGEQHVHNSFVLPSSQIMFQLVPPSNVQQN